ncbi:outer membrane protein [Polycladidibacter hongkongensis]|uniref:outer membrane protein n=1 Tax=Polycladidibacter hongkongensis TaxID=1647556 RepID=UPI00082D1974|nr:outer membrane beta-barrel protein [Pseudovibrio hongkongensis]
MKTLAIAAALSIAATSAVLANEGSTAAEKWQGSYVGVKADYNNMTTKLPEVVRDEGTLKGTKSYFSGSLYAGYNHVFNDYLVTGLETTFSVNNTSAKKAMKGDNVDFGVQNRFGGDVGLRVGVAVGDFMPFAKASFGMERVNVRQNYFKLDKTYNKFYYGVGGGVEWKVTDNVSIRGEYQYKKYNKGSYHLNRDIVNKTVKDDTGQHTYGVGVAYHF